MLRVSTMDFSTPCCTRPRSEPWAHRRLGAVLLCLLALLWQAWSAPAHSADALASLELERGQGALFLSASLRLQLPQLVEEALLKGIAMHFVAEVDVVRERWYWSNKKIAQTQRYLRLSYQPLTRRWRLVQASQPFAASGLGVMLGQNFDELADALAVLQRIARWRVVPAGVLDDAEPYLVHFSFRLDLSQMPRPLQWGVLGRSDWNLHIERSLLAPPVVPQAGVEEAQ